jgi:hypothetical protein
MASARRASPSGAQRLDVLEGAGDDGNSSRLDLAIAALRARVDEEFKITERLDSKSRQAFALAGGGFAIAQTVAFGSFGQAQVDGAARFVTLGLAAIAAIFLTLTAHRLTDAEELRPEEDIDPSKIEEWARDLNDEDFAKHMVVHLRVVAERRAASNERRAEYFNGHRGVLFWSRWTLLLTGAELIFAIVFRT